MRSILMTSSAVLLVSGLSAAQAQDAVCPEDIDAFTRNYEEALATAGGEGALSASEQAELFGLQTTAENLFRAGNLEMCAQAIERAQLMLDTAIAPTALQPGELVGMEVRNSADEYLGEVDDITIDPVSGRIAYVLVEHGGFLGIGDNLFAVPWRSVSWSPGAEWLLLDIDEERLENAPRYDEEEMTAQERRAWLLSVHNYYGVEPYWQDNISSMALGGGAGDAGASAVGASAVGTGQSGETEQPTGVVAVPVEVESVTMPEGEGTEGGGAAQQSDATSTTEAPAEGAAPATGESEAGTTDLSAVSQPLDGTPTTEAPTGDTPGEETATAGGGQPGAGVASQGAVATVPAPGEAAGNGDVSMLSDRMEELENRIEELSQQGVGEDLRQAVGNLQEQVRQLAEQGPGEEVQQSVAELRDQVQQLAQQGPGEEVRQAIAGLEDRVRQLAESQPGQDVRQAIASLETRVEELAESGPGREMRQMMERMQAEIRELSGRPADSATLTVTPGAGAGAGTGAATNTESRTAPAAGRQAAQPAAASDTGTGNSGAGGMSGAGNAGTPPATEQQAATGAASSQGPAAGSAAGSAADSETIRLQRQTDSSGQTFYSSVPQSSSDLPSPAAGEDEPRGQTGGNASGQAALGDPAEGSEPCETGITRLEEDLAAAEQQGIAIDEARSELEAAQAMLQRASEALCRAAVKRARDELVAQGFQPTMAN